ncbi:hypothetical protein UlMin_001866 [Ulmus minor]
MDGSSRNLTSPKDNNSERLIPSKNTEPIPSKDTKVNHATKLGGLGVVPYIFLNLPSVLFNLLRGEVGKWIAFIAVVLKGSWVGMLICLLIGCYLLQEHIRAFGGFKNSFTQSHEISNTVGIIALLVFPVWALVVHFL